MTRFPALEGKEGVAVHSGEMIGHGLFAKILRDVELTRDDFLKDKKRKKKSLGNVRLS